MRKTVYLCGPIAGCTYEEARFGWRSQVAMYLKNADIDSLSPMRFTHSLENEGVLGQHGYVGTMHSPKAITARDRFDTQRCDLMFCNVLGASKASIGSAIEFGWADSKRIPIVLCMEPEGNPHDHAMIREMASFIVPSIEEGIEVVLGVLCPGV